jgi:hypothetical protein
MEPMQLAHVFRELAPEQRLNLGVRAPAPWLSTGADNLRVTSFGTLNGIELVIAIRWLTLQGEVVPFVFRHVPGSSGAPVETLHRLSDGWLLTSTAQVASGTVPSPGIFVRLDIVNGLAGAVQLVGTLAQGYVSSQAAISYPLSPIVGADASAGTVQAVVGPNPAAGADWSVTVPGGQRWRLLSIRSILVTSAAVANREVQLAITANALVVALAPSGVAQVASETRHYTWYAAAARGAGAVSLNVTVPLPAVLLPAGATIETITQAIDVADDWGPPALLIEVFPA